VVVLNQNPTIFNLKELQGIKTLIFNYNENRESDKEINQYLLVGVEREGGAVFYCFVADIIRPEPALQNSWTGVSHDGLKP
jgi:hypothetical protein